MENHPYPQETLNDRTARRIRGIAGEKRLTAQELGNLLGVSRQSAAKRLAGSQAMSLPELDTIAAWLGTTPAHLVRAED